MNYKTEWYDKPYYSLGAWFKNKYHEKCGKISIDAGFTCPNRDGTLSDKGCIFCAGGSGSFAVSPENLRELLAPTLDKAYEKNPNLNKFMVYFQAYTNTYAPVDILESIYENALKEEKVIGISIATRPDCLGEDVISLLSRLKKKYEDKFIWVELGLQTIHEKTAAYIRRCYNLSVYDDAVKKLKEIGIPVIVHIILGLPGETPEMMYETVKYVSRNKPFGVKLQLLHVLKGTDLAEDFLKGRFEVLTLAQYIDILINSIELLDRDIVIHRVTGDGDRKLLIAPLWSVNKIEVLNTLHKEMKLRGAYQGRKV